MTDYTVRARFEADANGYIQAVKQAQRSTQELGDTADKAGKQTGKAFDGADKSVDKAGQAADKASQQTEELGSTAQAAGESTKAAFDGADTSLAATGDAAADTKKSVEELSAAVEKSNSTAEAAAGKLEAAKQRETAAIQRVRDAEQELNAARQSGDQDAVIAASANLASAKDDAAQASKELAAAERDNATAADAAAAAQRELDQSTSKLGDTMRAAGDFVRQNERDLQTMGTAFTVAGATLTALAAGATMAAIEWESAWAGVQKTNDGTAEQMANLESELRGLATTLPATHTEVAAVAEAAGQLGVSVEDVSSFTKTMINMGETTNLSAEEAATGIARFSNVMGTAWADAERLGSTIVGLGNNFATTEAEILHMSQRIAPVGRVMNMTEADVLSMATAMSSVGIEAEAGGTAISMVMRKIDAAVRDGGSELTSWAEAAGVSANEFATAWQERPAMAMQILSEGLAETANMGGDVSAILSELGVKGVRESATMLSLASASGLLADALDEGATAWSENSALAEEAEVRYATAEAKISVAWNNIKDAAINAGSGIAPVVGDIADLVADLAGWFGQLPAPVLGSITALSGVAGVASLAAGGLMMIAPRAVETWDAFKRLYASTSPLAGGLRNVGTAVGIAAAAMAAFTIAKVVIENMREGTATAEEFRTALIELNNTGDFSSIDELFNIAGLGVPGLIDAADGIDGMADALRSLDPETQTTKEGIQQFWTELIGIPGPIKDAIAELESMDEALASMDPGEAAGHFRNLREEMEAAGRQDFSSWEGLEEKLPEYAAAIQAMADATGETYTEAELLDMAMGKLPPVMQQAKEAADQAAQQDALQDALDGVGLAADGAVESLSEYLDLLFETGLANMSANEAQRQHTEAINGFDERIQGLIESHGSLNGALDETTGYFSNTTDVGIEAGRAFEEIAESGMNSAQAMADAGASQEDVQASLEGTYESLKAAARQFVDTDEEAAALARTALGIEDEIDIETWMSDEAQRKADELSASLDTIPEGLQVIIDMDDSAREEAFATAEAIDEIGDYKTVDVAISDNGTAGQVQSKYDALQDKEVFVFVDDDGTATEVQEQIVNIDGKTTTVYVDDNGTIYTTQEQIDGIDGGTAQVDTQADTSGAVEGIQDVTGRPWMTSITGVPQMGAAEESANTTARDRTSTLTGIPNMGNAEGSANTTARDRFPDFFGIPHMGNAEGSANTTARDRFPDFFGIPHTGTAEGDLNTTARERNAPINATKGSDGVSSWLDGFTKARTAIVNVVRRVTGAGGYTGGVVGTDFGIPQLASGGRLPYYGLGTDTILGIGTHGYPTALVDDGEWVINEESATDYNTLLGLVNRNDPSVRHLQHLNNGGTVGAGPERLASSIAPAATSIDYTRLAEALGDRRNVTYQANLHTADTTFADAMDGFRRMDMEESRR